MVSFLEDFSRTKVEERKDFLDKESLNQKFVSVTVLPF